jgi:hypothetical protein
LGTSLGDFEGGGKEAREDRESNQAAVVAVYMVSQAGIAVGVESHHAVQIDRGGVGVDDAAPRNFDAILAVGDA